MRPDTGRRKRPARNSDIEATARAFVQARRSGQGLASYPGALPADMDVAYRIQDAAIDLWADAVGGWKVGRIPPAMEQQYRSDRLAGPIFQRAIRETDSDVPHRMPVYVGGFAAIEAEFVVVIARDALAGQKRWSMEEAADMMADLRIGLELASSPLAAINDLGPAVTASDFGNNAGLIVGPSIREWRTRSLESMSCEALVEASSVGKGGAFNLTGGPVRSVQFILELTAARGRPLKAGDLIATGQTTGIHDIEPGQTGRVDFGADGAISLTATEYRSS
jgi:2-keto-4-pentenoate hydratase